VNDSKLNRDPDILLGGRSIYDVSANEIFWKNFLAGLGRGLGMFLFNLLLWVMIGGLFFGYVWPLTQPLVSSFQSLSTSLQGLQQVNESFSTGLPSFFGR